jgi:hypothetical protein
MGVGEIAGDVGGVLILAFLVVQAGRWCLAAASAVGDELGLCVGGYPPESAAPDDVQKLRDAGAL